MTEHASSLSQRIIERIFSERFQPGTTEMPFTREELITTAEALGAPRPKNVGDNRVLSALQDRPARIGRERRARRP